MQVDTFDKEIKLDGVMKARFNKFKNKTTKK